jgi:hypothetical protein
MATGLDTLRSRVEVGTKNRISLVRHRIPFKEFTNGNHVNPRLTLNLGAIVRHMCSFWSKGSPDLTTKPGLPFFALTLFFGSLFTPEQHPLVSEALLTISGSVRNTATLLEVLVATKMPPLAGLDPVSA